MDSGAQGSNHGFGWGLGWERVGRVKDQEPSVQVPVPEFQGKVGGPGSGGSCPVPPNGNARGLAQPSGLIWPWVVSVDAGLQKSHRHTQV